MFHFNAFASGWRQRSLGIVGIVLLGALCSTTASAQTTVAIATDSPQTMIYRQQMQTQIANLNATLHAQSLDIHYLSAYLEGGGTGNGVVELLAAKGQQLSRINSFNDEYWNNFQQYNKDQTMEAVTEQRSIAKYEGASRLANGAATTQACEDVTMASTSGAAHGNTQVAKAGVEHQAAVRMGQNRPQLAALADLIKNRAPFCTPDDVTNKRPGCAQVGPLPGADLSASSLTMGAIDKSKPNTPTNYSFTPLQEQAAQAYLNNVLPLPATQPQGVSAETTAGKQALAQFNRYQARWSVINDALSSMIAQHTPMTSAPDGWSQNEAAYKRMFPNQDFPQVPSESEVLHFDAYLDYADPQKKAQIAVMGDSDLAREQVRLAALQARLQMETIANQEKEIKLLSVLVTQQMDPVTANGVANQVPAANQ